MSDVFRPWLEQLRSTDRIKRMEAAFTLASVAPKSLESELLGFADDSELEQFAPLAFHRLNTPRSIAAMTELLAKTPSESFVHQKASAYLSHEQCGDDF